MSTVMEKLLREQRSILENHGPRGDKDVKELLAQCWTFLGMLMTERTTLDPARIQEAEVRKGGGVG
jgi:hypothetical protein